PPGRCAGGAMEDDAEKVLRRFPANPETLPKERSRGDELLASWLPVVAATAVSALFAALAADLRWAAALGAYIARHGSIPDFVPYAAAPSHGWRDVPA